MSATPLYSARMVSTVSNGIRLVRNEATVFSLKELLLLYRLGAATSVDYDGMSNESSIATYTELKNYYATGLPTGLICSMTGAITGTPMTTGTFTVLVEVTSSLYTRNGNYMPTLVTYDQHGSCFIAVTIIVEDAPTLGTLPPAVADSRIVFDDQLMVAGNSVNLPLQAQGTYTNVWQVSGLPPGLTFGGNSINGTPTAEGDYVVTVRLTYNSSYGGSFVVETRDFMFTVAQGVPVITTALFNAVWNGSSYYYPVDLEVGVAATLQLAATGIPTSWNATGLPTGMTINSTGLIAGTPLAAGKYSAGIVAANGVGTSAPFVVLFNVVEPVLPKVLPDSGIDLFFDVQSRELTLNAPKAERVLQAGESLVDSPRVPKLIIKNGETLRINLRFLKGGQVIDPDATAIRLGVASRAGSPLLLDCSTFTKEGTGSMTRHLMFVAVSSDEFTSLLHTYFDDEAVETAETTGDDARTIDAVCEVELVTGSGATLARLRSSALDAVILRSIF